MSIMFKWRPEDFDALVESCSRNEVTPYILKYMPKSGKIVEAGCGLARFVVYLSEMRYDIEGIEISQETVDTIKRVRPDLNIRQGDITTFPYLDNSVSGIISLGVVEHFIDGPELALREVWRILKPACYAVVTVPSLNYIRRLKYKSGYYLFKEKLKQVDLIRKLLRKELRHNKAAIKKQYRYKPYFVSGEFFEYRFTKKEFEDALVKVGFSIVESVPIGHIGGIYHEFGRAFVSFRNWKLYPNVFAKLLNYALSRIPFCCNHMLLCVVEK